MLVFDEGTAALDRQTEREVTAGIETLRGVKTLIIVAHRMATVRGCERLVYLREGRLVDVGPYSALLERDRGFRQLAELG